MDRWNSLKAQVALEFSLMVAVALIFFIAFAGIIITQQESLSHRKEEIVVEDLALKIQKEIITASQVRDGFYREFSLPSTIEGFEYVLENTENSIHVSTPRKTSNKRIPKITGNLAKGLNTINKTDGKIYIN